MTEPNTTNYPNVAQSIGITGIVILGMIMLSSITLVLNKLIGKEALIMVYYIMVIGIPFRILYSITKSNPKQPV